MTANPSLKTLIKILIGAAWIDGKIQPEEREYLHRIAKEKGVDEDPEIQPLLYEFRAVKPEECYGWVQEYLGDRPSSEACQQLIEAISGLVYSDGSIATEEATLLNKLQLLDPINETSEAGPGAILQSVRKLYQHWVSTLNNS